MHKHLKINRALLTVIVAILAGLVSAKLLAQGNPLVTLPWGILAVLVAFVAKNRREALTLGGLLGFTASYSYLWFDNTDANSVGKVLILIFIIIMPALFGLLAGAFCAWLGWLVKSRV